MRRQPRHPQLDELFGSSLRVRLLRFFLDHAATPQTPRMLAMRLRVHPKSLARELELLRQFELVTMIGSDQAKGETTFQVNTNALLYPEFKALFMKARLLIERALVSEIERLGSVRYLLLTGFFVGDPDAPTDLFIVGKINRKKLALLLRRFQRELQREIRYTVMSKNEFKYRHDITDRFLYHLLENQRKIVVIDELFAAR